ncbi:MAG: hypothetical protein WA151_09750 [Desulfatirhabdiaceae bacterium]
MDIFKEEDDTKRMIFNIRYDLVNRLLSAREEARNMGKRLDIETAINKALEKFLQKAEKRIREEKKKKSQFLQAFDKKADDPVLTASENDANTINIDDNGQQ